MVLQRIQTLYLLVAAILMATFTFLPVMEITSNEVITVGALTSCGVNQPSVLLLCLDALISLLTLVTIFKYKNLKKQISLAGVLLLLLVSLLVCIGVMFVMQKGIAIAVLQWPVALPVVAIVMVMLARAGMKHDKKLLSDSERIR